MRVPVATYRLQFNSSFDFDAARDIVPYLADLGISDIYASSIFLARKGSTHGYDVADHNQINPELGGIDGFEKLVETLRDHKMGLIHDTIPNHMAYSIENPMMADLLERGARSKYFHFFDVDWNHRYAGAPGKILAPFLGDLYGDALECGEINLIFGEEGFATDYRGLRFPLRLESYAGVLGLEEYPENQEFGDLRQMISEIVEIPEEPSELKKKIWKLYNEDMAFKNFLDLRLKRFRGKSIDLLDSLLSEQIFRLSFWKVASQEINYRRFFTINDLIALNAERLEVFDHTHSLLFDLFKNKKITGLRIDHIDGLCDPEEYLQRLNERLLDVYVVVEKILGYEETLPDWPVQGTTGYDFLNMLGGLFCQKDNMEEFDDIYSDFTGQNEPYEDLVYEKKRLIMERYMGGEIDNLSYLLKDLSDGDRRGHDFTFYNLRNALSEFMASLSVYRTHRSRSRKEFSDADRAVIKNALAKALVRKPELQRELDLLGQLLLMPFESSEKWRNCIGFISRLQQFTGPLMAKGFEDTVLYCYNRLISLNEVGSSPERFGTSMEEFHNSNLARSRRWPNSLNATATHDTKRGEDARARISILSEVPGEWARALERWRSMNEPLRRRVNGQFVPDRHEEYFLYQAIMGALPFSAEDYPSFLERANGYMVKALREAKVHSDWMYPDTAYEEAYLSFFNEIMEQYSDFFEDMAAFTGKVAQLGMHNSLSQSLIKITSPGVPDFYQGTELWDFSFVDPDNRRPVNFEKRRSYLAEIIKRENDLPGLISDLMAKREDGRVKLFLIHQSLQARKHNADLFFKGSYIPLRAEGPKEKRAIAFARVHKGGWAVTLAPRFPASQLSWKDTSITLPKRAPQRWRDAITGEEMEGRRIYLQEAFSYFPVSLLLGDVK